MIDIRPALRSYVLGYAPVAAIVGNRMYHVKIKEGTTADTIVFNRISGQGYPVMEGMSGFTIQRFQIDALSLIQDNANILADLVRDRIDGFRGSMGDSPIVTVHGIFMVDQRDDYDDVSKFVRVSRDYQIAFKEL